MFPLRLDSCWSGSAIRFPKPPRGIVFWLGNIVNAEAWAQLEEIAPRSPAIRPAGVRGIRFHEAGGMREVDGVWVDHCHGYRDEVFGGYVI